MSVSTIADNTVFAEKFVGLGFLWSVSYIKPIPTHENIFLLREKLAEMPPFTYFFLDWVGLGLGSSTVS